MTAYVISDLHLAPAHAPALSALERFLDSRPVPGDSLYVLGDLFEYWAGDDDLDTPFNRHVVDRFAACAARGTALYWIPGNRDFLAGDAFAEAARMLPLAEPYLFDLHGVRTALLHGDTLCTDDRAYQAFRAEARSERWRREFLGRPLAERRADIEAMRERSEREKAAKSAAIMDVNDAAVARLFAASGATQVVHGHTHRPGRHDYVMHGRQVTRWVLPAWEDAPGGLRVDSRGAALIDFQ
jgi:UDP-2,3-diacylglucosamine hydrolase